MPRRAWRPSCHRDHSPDIYILRDRRVVYGHIASLPRCPLPHASSGRCGGYYCLDDADRVAADVAGRVVSLREFIGQRVTAISGGALGDVAATTAAGTAGRVLPMANDALGVSAFVVHGMHIVILLDVVGLLPFPWWLIFRPLARFFRGRLRHDQLLRQWLHNSGASFAQQLLAAGSEAEAMGHLWVMTLGSTIPETGAPYSASL